MLFILWMKRTQNTMFSTYGSNILLERSLHGWLLTQCLFSMAPSSARNVKRLHGDAESAVSPRYYTVVRGTSATDEYSTWICVAVVLYHTVHCSSFNQGSNSLWTSTGNWTKICINRGIWHFKSVPAFIIFISFGRWMTWLRAPIIAFCRVLHVFPVSLWVSSGFPVFSHLPKTCWYV